MRKFNFSLLCGFILAISSPLQGAEEKKDVKAPEKAASSTPNAKAEQKSIETQREEYNLLKRDQIDTTDTLAIPFDDSEVEDEEEVNRIEGKDLFNLPKPAGTK